MSEQVRRYKNLVALGIDAVKATDYDALHAEAEALRAENERLRETERALIRNHNLHVEKLEAARGLLREVEALAEAREHGYAERQHGDVLNYRCANSVVEMLPRIQAFLTATPAPEVRQAEQRWSSFDEWLAWELDHGDGTMAAASDAETRLARRLWFCLERAPLAEQGERQEASGYACAHCGEFTGKPAPYKAHVECSECGKLTAATCAAARGFAKQYTTPQPGPYVRGLAAFALELIDGAWEGGSFDGGDIQEAGVRHGLLTVEQRQEACGKHCDCAEYGFPAECYRLTPALATHRQAQQGGSHDT